jgi:hypothetical protein
MLFTKFSLPKGKKKSVYRGWCLKLGIFKFERITGKKNQFTWRFEISAGWD